MFRGMATINLYADDLAAARAWYTDLLHLEPYFAREGYVEFRVGDDQDELGIVDARFRGPGDTPGTGGPITYWHVDDVDAALADLLRRGATEHDHVRERGEGFRTASVVDPFGNLVGVMENPHWSSRHGSPVAG
ncbi:VOC family protein [Cellulomonas soli]|uniref:Glyoxalase n=1 Tax=Cellulomonas soli TaxID=931535 RepID=A0A512PAQ2_9CELL|nr:VOC family protein [Cellulomonas soli]NYI57429.1 putative enzyme related to lactoylglutathione lyase [Cellulomonas soli]GEP68290.1 glyoxalase [Cellulomonas soli]